MTSVEVVDPIFSSKYQGVKNQATTVEPAALKGVDTKFAVNGERRRTRLEYSLKFRAHVLEGLEGGTTKSLRGSKVALRSGKERLLPLSQFYRPSLRISLRTPRNARNASSELEAGFQPRNLKPTRP